MRISLRIRSHSPEVSHSVIRPASYPTEHCASHLLLLILFPLTLGILDSTSTTQHPHSSEQKTNFTRDVHHNLLTSSVRRVFFSRFCKTVRHIFCTVRSPSRNGYYFFVVHGKRPNSKGILPSSALWTTSLLRFPRQIIRTAKRVSTAKS